MSRPSIGFLCSRHGIISLALLLALAGFGCGRSGGFEYELSVRPKPEVRPGESVEINVSVKRPPGGIRYRWRPDFGKCDPQESDSRQTKYTAPSEFAEDLPSSVRIRFEVLQAGREISKDIVIITINRESSSQPSRSNGSADPAGAGPTNSISAIQSGAGDAGKPSVRITMIPPYDPVGGPDSSAQIAGDVSGVSQSGFRIVLYAYTNTWYVQPLEAAPFTTISQGGKWSTWTHTGTQYAALLVRPSFTPPKKPYALPDLGGDVVAVSTVMGKEQ